MLTIGQLAASCDVTPKTIRYYHHRGLLPEPDRGASGYRRYDADAVIRLARIKAYTDRGVPLADIPALLDQPDTDLNQVLDRLDTHLDQQIRRLQQTRQALAEVRRAPEVLLPAGLTDHLARLTTLGIDPAGVELEHDTWLLLARLYPDDYPAWLERLTSYLDDPDIAQLYLRLHQARQWPADDPRLAALAHDTRQLAAQQPTNPAATHAMHSRPHIVELVLQHSYNGSPSWTQLHRLITSTHR